MEPFSRTRRLLRRQRFREQAGIALVLLAFFAGWCVWLAKGTVPLYVVSQQVRFEVEELPVPIQTPVDGQVTVADVGLGRQVRPGDVLLRLDTRPLELRRAELDVAIRSGERSLEALKAQWNAENEAREAVVQMGKQSSLAASARVSLEERSLAFKQKESEMAGRLHDASLLSSLDALHAAESLETQRAQLAAASARAALDTSISTMSLRERDARLAGVRITMAQSEADLAKWKAQTETLEYEIARRILRAPVAGELADVMPLTVGATLTSQQRIATLLPRGRVRLVAFLSPKESSGRVRTGQNATLRLDNFPWVQYGTVGAVVEQVGREPRDGNVRIELSVNRPNPDIPLEHGLTGLCEIEVERTSPLRLLLRSVLRLEQSGKETPPLASAPQGRIEGDDPGSEKGGPRSP